MEAVEHTSTGSFRPLVRIPRHALFGCWQEERDNFLKGRRCESQGLGIGAFAYYRRVVENQKGKILDEIIRACRKIGANDEMIATLEKAKVEVQFSKAMDTVQDAVPQALLISGHNPLTLLHSAISLGLHSKTDNECLAYAQHVRVIMIEFVEKISQVLKEQKNIDDAVSALFRTNRQSHALPKPAQPRQDSSQD